ncbi:MAG: 2-amino-4-hydroxy-6-hydroxymethyldihydropteridine diphosphokinase [Nitrospinae bacterium]|nr:2-amino-4-hydroxy-6-hydroxymethyldihydropteridine diphosphokinase [Nitrospinota bacterium]
MVKVFLSLGANLGDRVWAIDKAIGLILSEEGITDAGRGRFYETEPQGIKDQPWFLNTAIAINTDKPPSVLLGFLQGVEKAVGRVGGEAGGPRVVDIDIIFYGSQTVNAPGLAIPHPRAFERKFVLAPLADIAPDFVYPGRGKTVSQTLKEVSENGQGIRLVTV